MSTGYGAGVQPLRSFLLTYPRVAAIVLLAAMLLRLAVPAGFMPMVDRGAVSLAICPGVAPAGTPATAHPRMHGMTHGGEGTRNQSPCAFADLSLPVIGGADPVQIAAALVFILIAALFLGAAVPPPARARLRPPLRGPPLSA